MHCRRKFMSEMKKLKLQWVKCVPVTTRLVTQPPPEPNITDGCSGFPSLISFLLQQSVQFWSYGFLPQQQYREDPDCIHTFGCCFEVDYVIDSSPDSVPLFTCWRLLTKLSGDSSFLIRKMKMITSTFLRMAKQIMYLYMAINVFNWGRIALGSQ